MTLEALVPSHHVRNAYLNFPVEATRSSERRVYCVRSVGRANNDYVSPCTHSIHQGKELRDDSSLYLTSDFFSLRCYRVHLIDEDDARSSLLRFLEDLT